MRWSENSTQRRRDAEVLGMRWSENSTQRRRDAEVLGMRWSENSTQRRRVAEGILELGRCPRPPKDAESQAISSYLGYGVKPHLPINLCVSAPLR